MSWKHVMIYGAIIVNAVVIIINIVTYNHVRKGNTSSKILNFLLMQCAASVGYILAAVSFNFITFAENGDFKGWGITEIVSFTVADVFSSLSIWLLAMFIFNLSQHRPKML